MSLRLTHIIVPIDFSDNATLALEQAVALAKDSGAKLTVVYIIPQVIFHPDWATDLEETLDISDVTEEALDTLEKMVIPYRQQGVTVNTRVLSGGPYVEIVRLAEHLKAELIVLGAHGISGRKPSLMGSVAEKVVREAPCSVLVARASH